MAAADDEREVRFEARFDRIVEEVARGVTDDRRRQWRQAARFHGLDVGEWTTKVLDAAAKDAPRPRSASDR